MSSRRETPELASERTKLALERAILCDYAVYINIAQAQRVDVPTCGSTLGSKVHIFCGRKDANVV